MNLAQMLMGIYSLSRDERSTNTRRLLTLKLNTAVGLQTFTSVGENRLTRLRMADDWLCQFVPIM